MLQRRVLSSVGIVFLVAWAISCERKLDKPVASFSATLPAVSLPASSTVQKLGGLVTPRSAPVTRDVNSNATEVPLDGGARIAIAAGAFHKPARVSASICDLNLQHVSLKVKSAQIYVISTDVAFDHLSGAVYLEIPKPTKGLTVVELEEAGFKQIPIVDGPVTRVPITHFSERVTGIIEWNNSVFGQINRALEGIDDPTKKERSLLEGEDKWVKAFFGVGEPARRDHNDMCQEMRAMLTQFKSEKNLEFPSDYSINELTLFLVAGDSASKSGGYFWDIVAPTLGEVHKRVEAMAGQGQVSIAQVLKICIEENGNNIPRGALAAHNYLKETAYQGRSGYQDYANDLKFGVKPEQLTKSHAKMVPAMEQWGRRASLLEPWRKDPVAPEGYFDKMGPIYHVFAAMSAGLWGGHLYGSGAINAEGLLRSASIGADHPDSPKAFADDCGLSTAVWLLDEKYAETPKETGFQSEDVKELDGRCRMRGDGGDGFASSESIGGSYTLRDAQGEGGAGWKIYKVINAAEAYSEVAQHARSFQLRLAPDFVRDAQNGGGSVSDASLYTENESQMNLTSTQDIGNLTITETRIHMKMIYREVFVISFSCSKRTERDRTADSRDSPRAAKPKDYTVDRDNIIAQCKKLIDRRFPPP